MSSIKSAYGHVHKSLALEISGTSSSTTKAHQNKTSSPRVQFSHTTRVNFIPGLDDISEEERKSVWLADEESAIIQHTVLKTVKRMRQGKNIDEDRYCTRGLEHMRTADHVQQRQINKASVTNAVLTEQQRQRQSRYYDAARISKVSSIHSKQSKEEALRKGSSDAAFEGLGHKRWEMKSFDKMNINRDSNNSQRMKSTLRVTSSAQMHQAERSNILLSQTRKLFVPKSA